MKNTFSLLFYLRKSKANAMDFAPIYLRITVNGKRAELSINRTVQTQKWDSARGRVKGNTSEVKSINSYIDIVRSKIYDHHQNLLQRNKEITALSLKNAYLGIGEKKWSLLEVFQYHNARMKNLIGKQYAKSTYTKYKTSLMHVTEFIKHKFGVQDVALHEINYEFITSFEYYLRVEKRITNNTVIKYLTHLRKIIYLALSNSWLEKDPFMNFKMKREDVEKDFLTKVELKQLIKMKTDIFRIEQVKDIFVFCCYTGLTYSDVAKLTNDNLSNGIDGQQWIRVNRTKTNTPSRIPLLGPALQIIEKYKNHPVNSDSNRLLPTLSNQKMNAYLKEIADLSGIKKNLTMHVARHTFATYMLTEGVPIETVSDMLGHKSIKTTQIYAKITTKKISDDMQPLNKKLHAKLHKTG